MSSWQHKQQLLQQQMQHHRMWALPLTDLLTTANLGRRQSRCYRHRTSFLLSSLAPSSSDGPKSLLSAALHASAAPFSPLSSSWATTGAVVATATATASPRQRPQPLQPSLSSSSRPNTRLYAGSPSLLSLPSDSDSSDDDDDENENDDPVVASSDDDDYDDVSEGDVLIAVEHAEMLWEEALAARRVANELIDLAEKEAQSAQYTAQTADTIVRTDRLTGRAISMETLAQVDAAARRSMDATDMVGKAVRAGQHADSLEKKAEEALKRSEDLLEKHLKDHPDDSTLAEPSGGDEDKGDDDEDQL